jgi:ribonuclease G
MSKEMIISVNGREKKIAIVDNGQTTEFYIERGEENSGVVGNIYKGRVQRVLPGMQSAFVDIGLERDGFLYVSDFFDEEEEIERIVMEKSEKGSPEEAEREATDHIHKERLKREKHMEDAQEIAEPLAEADGSSDDVEDAVDQPAKGRQQSSRRDNKPKGRDDRMREEEATSEKEESRRDEKEEIHRDEKRGPRGRNDNRRDENRTPRERDEKQRADNKDSRDRDDHRRDDNRQQRDRSDKRENEIETPIERDNEPRDRTDARDKKGRGQKSKRGVAPPKIEFDSSGFERIIDDTETGEMFKDAYMQEAIVDKVRAIEFDMEAEGPAEVGSILGSAKGDSYGFERIADEDDFEPEASSAGKGKARTSRKKKKATKKVTETSSDEEKPSSANVSGEESEDKPAAKGKSKPSSKGRSRKPSPKNAKLADGEARVKDSDNPSEMAVRRGGRGRRRPTKGEDEKPSNGTDNKKPQRTGGRRPSSQPTITDLLDEGQEILVQIAKEPIARKGARITSHIALPGRFLVYMPTIEHLGVSRKIESAKERSRLRTLIQNIKAEVDLPSGGFIVRTAGIGISEDDLTQDARYLVRTWLDIKKDAEKAKSPALVHQDLDIVQRLLRDHLSDDYAAIRVDSEDEYRRIVEFINLIQPKMVKRVKFYTQDEPILERFGVQEEINKALKPRVWLRSGGYLVINQTEALVAIDVNTGKFVGKGNARLEDTITKTNMEAVEEIARQIRLRDLGGIIVLDLIDMEDRRNRHKVLGMLQDALASDKSPTKVLSFNDFGLIIMTRKRVKQSLERTMCSPCTYCDSAGWIKSAQTVCYEILDEARSLAKGLDDVHQTTLRVHPEVAKAMRESESEVLEEIEAYLGNVDVTGDSSIHQEQFDFAFI